MKICFDTRSKQISSSFSQFKNELICAVNTLGRFCKLLLLSPDVSSVVIVLIIVYTNGI